MAISAECLLKQTATCIYEDQLLHASECWKTAESLHFADFDTAFKIVQIIIVIHFIVLSPQLILANTIKPLLHGSCTVFG